MSLNIEDPEADRLAHAIAQETGESVSHVVTEALRERYARIEKRKKKQASLSFSQSHAECRLK